MYDCFTRLLRLQNSWGQHGTHLGPAGPRWAPCCPHEPCYQGMYKNMGFILIQANPTRILRRKYLTPSQPSVTGDNLNISCKRTGFSLRLVWCFVQEVVAHWGLVITRLKRVLHNTVLTKVGSHFDLKNITVYLARHGVVHSEQAEEYNGYP